MIRRPTRSTRPDTLCPSTSRFRSRGAPLIGAPAAYGLCMALRADASDASLDAAHDRLLATHPTAINLKWALDRMVEAVRPLAPEARTAAAYARDRKSTRLNSSH